MTKYDDYINDYVASDAYLTMATNYLTFLYNVTKEEGVSILVSNPEILGDFMFGLNIMLFEYANKVKSQKDKTAKN